ncbi:hypothetical protein QQ054_21470 [Oscillatoria amoena NRMC-F 0135]|nr:hypothetical protein [Oscillatoria amoena NRMC-F 0135]
MGIRAVIIPDDLRKRQNEKVKADSGRSQSKSHPGFLRRPDHLKKNFQKEFLAGGGKINRSVLPFAGKLPDDLQKRMSEEVKIDPEKNHSEKNPLGFLRGIRPLQENFLSAAPITGGKINRNAARFGKNPLITNQQPADSRRNHTRREPVRMKNRLKSADSSTSGNSGETKQLRRVVREANLRLIQEKSG